MAPSALLADSLQKHHKQLLTEWLRNLQAGASDGRRVRISPQELSTQADEFLQLLTAVVAANSEDRNSAQFKALHGFLESLSRSRVQQGFGSAETATFIFSFKQPLFTALRTEAGSDEIILAQ
jgi:rsbT co-antagonist protein RsbR